MTITKKFLSVFLVIILCFCIVFQCSLNSYAVFGVDDALLIGAICLDLAACGVTIYSVSQFVQSDTFADFTHQLGADIDHQISVIKRNGELFFATTKLGWGMVTNWVKNHFSGATEDKTITYDTSLTASPEFLILSDGTEVPYNGFMEHPFFIYRDVDTGYITAYWMLSALDDCGIMLYQNSMQFYSVGRGQRQSAQLVSGSWVVADPIYMSTGITVKHQQGSVANINLGTNTPKVSGFFQYRTINIWSTSSSGLISGNYPPAQTMPEGEAQTANVRMHSDGLKYPGAIDAPTQTIKDGEQVLIKVPDSMVVDEGNGELTLTTNGEVIGQAIADTTAADVEPHVLTQTAVDGVDVVVGDVIADTPAGELSGNAQADIETANKFRLPKSFLEGFPFSIPYSIYIGIKSFVAEPQAPVFDLPFVISRFGINETVNIDLNRFSPLARLCRSFLSIVWVVGLALGSYKLIKH